MRVLVLGRGAIGVSVAEEVMAMRTSGVELVGVVGRPDRDEILGLLGRTDLLVEAAGHEALAQYGPPAIAAGIDVVVASTGALANPRLEVGLSKGPGRLHLPSGAIGGMDLLASAAAYGGLESVSLTSHKRADLIRRPWMDESLLTRLEKPEVFTVFEGRARESALAFPDSANVAATLALRTIGLDRCRVRVVAELARHGTTHIIEASGRVGDYRFVMTNEPAPTNPRTSLITIYSILATVRARLHAA